MERKEITKKITSLAKELEDIILSNACGKYHNVVWDGRKAVVIAFAGKYGYNVTPLSRLSIKTVTTIYNDLKVDFDI